MTVARSGPLGFLERNLWAVLASLATLWSGYLTGQMTMRNQIERMDDRLKRVEGQLVGRAEFMSCTVRSLDRIATKVKTDLPCELKVTE